MFTQATSTIRIASYNFSHTLTTQSSFRFFILKKADITILLKKINLITCHKKNKLFILTLFESVFMENSIYMLEVLNQSGVI